MSTISDYKDYKLYSLPGEILVHTINQMDFADIFRMLSASKYIRKCADSHQLYLNLCHKMGFKACNHVNNSVESVKKLYTLIKKIQQYSSPFSTSLSDRYGDWNVIQLKLKMFKKDYPKPKRDSIRETFKKFCIDKFFTCYPTNADFPSHLIDQWILLNSFPPSYRSDVLVNLIAHNKVDLAVELLENGYIPQTPIADLEGNSPFAFMHNRSLTSQEKKTEYDHLIDLLLKAGVNPNYKDQSGRAPLHYSVGKNDIELTKKLLTAGADPNSRENASHEGKPGDAPIHKLRSKCLSLVKLLVENGANVNLKGIYGLTILESILSSDDDTQKNPELIVYLKELSKI